MLVGGVRWGEVRAQDCRRESWYVERENKGESGGNRDKDKERQAATGPETSP